jgi:hypothetical protein
MDDNRRPPEEDSWNRDEKEDEPDSGDSYTEETPPDEWEPALLLPPNPWLRRKESGFIEGFVDTWKMLIFRPSQFFKTDNKEKGVGDALPFVIVFAFVAAVLSVPASFLAAMIPEWLGITNQQEMFLIYQDMLGLGDQLGHQPMWVFLLMGLICGIFLSPIFATIAIFIYAVIWALVGLLVIGKIDYNLCFRVHAFSAVASTVMIIMPIPYLREILMLVHWFFLLVTGFKHLGKMSSGQALIMALLPLAVFLFIGCCCFMGIFMLAASGFTQA